MSDPGELLSDDERALLLGETGSAEERDELRESLRARLREALADLSYLYLGLRDRDLDAVFAPEDQAELSAVRARTQEALTLLVLGMEQNDDAIEMRLEEALSYAAASRRKHADVDIDMTREPMADAEHYLRRVQGTDLEGPSPVVMEALLYDEATSPEAVADLFTTFEMEMSAEEVRAERGGDVVQRIPQTVVTDIRVEQVDNADQLGE